MIFRSTMKKRKISIGWVVLCIVEVVLHSTYYMMMLSKCSHSNDLCLNLLYSSFFQRDIFIQFFLGVILIFSTQRPKEIRWSMVLLCLTYLMLYGKKKRKRSALKNSHRMMWLDFGCIGILTTQKNKFYHIYIYMWLLSKHLLIFEFSSTFSNSESFF